MRPVPINFALKDRRVPSLVSANHWAISAKTKLRTRRSLNPNEKMTLTFLWYLVSVRILDSAMVSVKDKRKK